FVPFHPSHFWVHTRAIYLPMGYCYGRRISAEITPLIERLRQELYVQPFGTINWSKTRNNIAMVDLSVPHTKLLKLCNYIAVQECYELIKLEDENTDYLNICSHLSLKIDTKNLLRFMYRLGSDGMLISLTNGSQNWDTALTVLAAIETGRIALLSNLCSVIKLINILLFQIGLADDPLNHQSMMHALEFLDNSQIKKNPKNFKKCYRDGTIGSWSYSTRDQGYNVSDCSATCLEAVLNLQNKLKYVFYIKF
ncbi:17842_t:CDS:2, partial [Racocetra fulgida]